MEKKTLRDAIRQLAFLQRCKKDTPKWKLQVQLLFQIFCDPVWKSLCMKDLFDATQIQLIQRMRGSIYTENQTVAGFMDGLSRAYKQDSSYYQPVVLSVMEMLHDACLRKYEEEFGWNGYMLPLIGFGFIAFLFFCAYCVYYYG
jgi:hypothetical protein